MLLSEINNIHFIGVGGIGMSGLAGILLARGKNISGSDLKMNCLARELSSSGASIFTGHSSDNLPESTQLIIRSSCIPQENPEMLKAVEEGIPVISRGELLKLLIDDTSVSLAVTGTHGKTTTSALVAHVLDRAGMMPTSVIGGTVDTFGGNFSIGRGDMIVAEIDESDGFFRNYKCTYGVVTNIEREHIENYGSMEDLVSAYGKFIKGVSSSGALIYNREDHVLSSLINGQRGCHIGFGTGEGPGASAIDPSYGRKIEFDYAMNGKVLGRINSSLVGIHNVMNILAAVTVTFLTGVPFENIREAIASFKGVGRRFETKGIVGDISVIEDYAHHPTEISAVIKAAKDYGSGRVITVFQPHRYSRTRDLAEKFALCFEGSDMLVMTDIYSAHENVVDKMGAGELIERIDPDRFELIALKEKKDIPGFVASLAEKGDMILVVGAGDICEVSIPVVKALEERIIN